MTKEFTVIRTIHPVGQGAFYTEEFFDNDHNRILTVVFDCGSKTKIGRSNCINKVVSGAFVEGQTIDILFISHFDTDHVNGINKILKNRRHIRYVVLPQLDGNEWFYTIENTFASGENHHTTARRVYYLKRRLMSAGAKILQVRPIPDEGFQEEGLHPHTIDPEKEEPRQSVDNRSNDGGNGISDISGIGDAEGMIDSGTVFGIVKSPSWIYVPVNFTYGKDIKNLRNRIQTILDVDAKFHGNSIEKLTSTELCDFIERNRKSINDAYDAVFPCTNASSLCLYSGAIRETQLRQNIDNDTIIRSILIQKYIYHDPPKKIERELFFGQRNCEGCLFTGDSVMTKGENINKLRFVFSSIDNWSKRLGIFQLPHHGSKENFGKDSLDFLFDAKDIKCHMPLLCFASFGSTNCYGHPSDNLISLLSTYPSYFIGVTEAKHNTLRQRIDVLFKNYSFINRK